MAQKKKITSEELKILYEKLKDYPAMVDLINGGTYLRNRTVAKSGPSSAVIFVPRILLGQKVRVLIWPENSEIAGYNEAIEKRNKKISRLVKENRELKSDSETEASDTEGVENSDDLKDLEDEDAY